MTRCTSQLPLSRLRILRPIRSWVVTRLSLLCPLWHLLLATLTWQLFPNLQSSFSPRILFTTPSLRLWHLRWWLPSQNPTLVLTVYLSLLRQRLLIPSLKTPQSVSAVENPLFYPPWIETLNARQEQLPLLNRQLLRKQSPIDLS